MNETIKTLLASKKGILAADESAPTIEKRFKSVGVPSTETTRRDYRDMLFTTPKIEDYISGVILFDETIRQKVNGKTFVDLLNEKGILPGIKVDKGTVDLAAFPGEKVTEGLDGLRERLTEYAKLGAKFAKWRAVITIGDNIPSKTCIVENSRILARYAAFCQEVGIVPICEPETIMDGNHTAARCAEVTESALLALFAELPAYGVDLSRMLLKVNMILPGKDSGEIVEPAEVARLTLTTLKRSVPTNVPGIVFLSGGQSDLDATNHLQLMNKTGGVPWELSFSYSRALQSQPLAIWKGKKENVELAQKAFYHRAKMNSLARQGKYEPEMENDNG